MVKRRGDKTPDPPGGRAAERLRMFIDAQRTVPEQEVRDRLKQTSKKKKKKKASDPTAAPSEPPTQPRERRDAKQDRRKT